MARCPVWLAALCLMAGLALVPTASQAEDAAGTEPLLERANRWVFDVNARGGRAVADAWASLGARQPEVVPVAQALGRALFNLVNEPVAMVSHAVAADARSLGNTAARFAVNTTIGIAGLFDRAVDIGLPPMPADLGLALCRRGVPTGPFVVVPVLGPRTLRDAVADVVLGNMVVLAVLSPLVGGLISPGTFLLVAVLDEAAVLAVAHGFDPQAAALEGLDYQAMRAAYMAQRAARCAG